MLWGELGSVILAGTGVGEHGPGVGQNDDLNPALRYLYMAQSYSAAGVVLYSDGSHSGPVPYSGMLRLYEQGTGLVGTSSFSVSLPTAPGITSQPQSQSATEGASVTFSVVATGTAPLSYQWRRNGVNISGATSADYTLTAALADSGAVYSVRIDNTAGNVVSTGATLTVNAVSVPPSLTSQPVSTTVNAGSGATFSAAATGTAPIGYQWQRDGSDIPGATGTSYTINATTLADDGAYFRVRATNAAGSVTSTSAQLTVQSVSVAPSITQQPANTAVTEGQQATLSVVAAGTAPLSYQWRRNGVSIAGATAPSLALIAQVSDNGAVYSVIVSNAFGSVTSADASLTVTASTAPAGISAQPQDVAAEDGGDAVFAITATGAQPITYQWQRDGVNIPGATSASLALQDVALSDSRAMFSVRVANAYGSTLSRRALLTVPLLTLERVRIGARIDDDRFDADIPRWIDAAIALAEQYCDRYFAPRTKTFERDTWPVAGETFPVHAARAASVQYWDGAAFVALAPSAFSFFSAGDMRTGLASAAGQAWPVLGESVGAQRIRVSLTVGIERAADLPIEVEHFVMAYISLWADESRAAAPQQAKEFPWLYSGLDPLKVY